MSIMQILVNHRKSQVTAPAPSVILGRVWSQSADQEIIIVIIIIIISSSSSIGQL